MYKGMYALEKLEVWRLKHRGEWPGFYILIFLSFDEGGDVFVMDDELLGRVVVIESIAIQDQN